MIPRFSVSNFIAIVNQTFDVAFAGMVEVEGEVSGLKSYPPKYAFFDLKDDDGLVRCFVGFIFSRRIEILHFDYADCEHLQFQTLVFSLKQLARPHIQPSLAQKSNA
jgi:Exonuclease VII, large subunit